MYQISKLENGLRVVTHDMPGRTSAALGLWIGVGGRYESDKYKGAAHFLEHIVFKGSQKYTCGQIKEGIEGVGGTLNAFTSEEQTCFYAKIPANQFDQTFDILSDMTFFPHINTPDVTKEKTVIIEEIKMYHDLPQYYVLELLDQMVWPNHPLGKFLAGSIESVTDLKSKDLKSFHRRFYHPGNVVISAAGKVDHDHIVKMVEERLPIENYDGCIDFEQVFDVQAKPRTHFYHKDIEQVHMALGMPGVDENDPDRYALNLLNVILGGNMSSRLFVEVREKKGLAYSISSSMKCLHDTGLFMIRAGVDNKKIVHAAEVIIKELDKIRKKPITEDEFKRGKDYLLGQLQLALEDTMDHMLWIGESISAKNKVKTISEIIELYTKISIEDVNRVAKQILDPAKYNLAMVGPITKEQEGQLSTLLF